MEAESDFRGKLSESGFFKSSFNKLMGGVSNETMEKFGQLKGDEERIRFLSETVMKDVKFEWVTGEKSEDAARELKERGNKAFAKGDNAQALTFYTESMLKLPNNEGMNSTLAVVLANRSAALYHMEGFESAVRDIDYALSLGYPKELRYKVLERKAKCLLAEEKHMEAIEEFRRTLQALEESNLPTEKKLKMQADIQIMLRVMTKPETKGGRTNCFATKRKKEQKREAEPNLCSPRHKVYTSCCDKLEFREEVALGRYAAAAADIDPGDVLLIEKPYSSVLLQEYALSYCQHCFTRTLAPYPCRSCSSVVFCGEECRKKATSTYHKYECPVLATVYASGASVTVMMALRIVTEKSLGFFLEMKNALSVGRKKFQVYQSSDYETLYHLVRHENLRKKNDFFERTFMALFLLECLRKANYFSLSLSEGIQNSTDDEYFIGGLMLRHLQLLQFNAHEIFEVELQAGQKVDRARSVFIGGGIFTTLSLFNHSCDPCVVRYFRGETVVVRAIKPIKKGQTVAENYGPIFTTMRRPDRKAKLKSQYWFDCECSACAENWPSFEEMDDTVFRFRCDSRGNDGRKINACANVIPVPQSSNDFMVRCSACGQFTNILKGLKALQDTDAMFGRASRDADAGNFEAAVATYLEILKMLDNFMAPPFRDYHLCQQAIRTCMICMGNKCINC